MQEVNLRKKL